MLLKYQFVKKNIHRRDAEGRREKIAKKINHREHREKRNYRGHRFSLIFFRTLINAEKEVKNEPQRTQSSQR